MKSILAISILLLTIISSVGAAETENAFNLYLGQMTSNHWDDFFRGQKVDFEDSSLLTASLARRLGGYKELLSYEIEGQVVKHFSRQDHWEFNALGVLRWEPFWWDKWLETSGAFGLGPSYATQKPQIEIDTDGDSAHFLLYWMLELAVAPFAEQPELELVSRIHHRSNGYGLFADDGGSNALAIGFKYRF